MQNAQQKIDEKYNELMKNFVPVFGNRVHVRIGSILSRMRPLQKELFNIHSKRGRENKEAEIRFLKRNVIFLLTNE